MESGVCWGWLDLDDFYRSEESVFLGIYIKCGDYYERVGGGWDCVKMCSLYALGRTCTVWSQLLNNTNFIVANSSQDQMEKNNQMGRAIDQRTIGVVRTFGLSACAPGTSFLCPQKSTSNTTKSGWARKPSPHINPAGWSWILSP